MEISFCIQVLTDFYPFFFQNNPGTSKVLVAPPGSTLIQQQQHKVATNPAMPKIQFGTGAGAGMIQIQPAATVGGQPLFNLSLPMGQTGGNKRKAGDFDNGD